MGKGSGDRQCIMYFTETQGDCLKWISFCESCAALNYSRVSTVLLRRDGTATVGRHRRRHVTALGGGQYHIWAILVWRDDAR